MQIEYSLGVISKDPLSLMKHRGMQLVNLRTDLIPHIIIIFYDGKDLKKITKKQKKKIKPVKSP